jgi:hypothetical protein
MAPIEEMASIFGRGGGQKTHHVQGYYAPEARPQSSPIVPADRCSGQGQIPGILVEPLREWRNWQTRKT